MRKTRETLDKEIRDVSGFANVYYQPKSQMEFPCILYQKEDHDITYAGNSIYGNRIRYTITIIGKNCDNDHLINRFLEKFHYCNFDRRYKTSDNLYHDVLILYW